MYDKFDVRISVCSQEDSSEDFWYDFAILEASQILEGFNESEWEILLKELHSKTTLWQRRVVECLDASHNASYGLKIILELINTKDEDLFVACVDSLRGFDLSELSQDTKEQLLAKSNLLMKTASLPVKKVLEVFVAVVS